MLTLAFETANFGASGALIKDKHILAEKTWTEIYGQASFLVPALKALVEEAGYTFKDVEEVITTTGPGSFTGQRVGLSIARTLEVAGGMRVLGVTSFDWIARGFVRAHPKTDRPILVTLTTGRSDLFFQLFDNEGKALKDPISLLPQALGTYALQGCLIVGQERAALKEQDWQVYEGVWQPHARDLGLILRPLKTALHPFYLRPVDATPQP
ncbi:MAG: tRNA (adenosine(37)-N6)-threonylcarbamoyltransferase complex dimerization subunit type 1 TsaB [Alphaproteobacteria bacterium]|jgi:tRNA threonylcarbamoyladenosine biosynthesis protein TsaB|nr:tRNA (adenosine(37)-N6)-threonylcarbamoyltransferase complex dimerization subunit type 1 TsaB [Alphaproteobacteria bacterium]